MFIDIFNQADLDKDLHVNATEFVKSFSDLP